MAPFPPFNEGNIKNWFLQIEAIFFIQKITSQKITYLVPASPLSIVDELADLLESIAENEPYSYLKEAILKRTGRRDEDLLREFNNVTRDDRTPSQLLWYMKSRLGKKHYCGTNS